MKKHSSVLSVCPSIPDEHVSKNKMKQKSARILVVAPFTHQQGHYVTFPIALSHALAASGHMVTLLHARPFRADLTDADRGIDRICLSEQLSTSPIWWREVWHRLAGRPSNQCLAWIIWKTKPCDHDLVLWTDLQAHGNIWPFVFARLFHVYRHRSAFVKHHRPPKLGGNVARYLRRMIPFDRVRLAGLKMIVFSEALKDEWEKYTGRTNTVTYVPWGVWPTPSSHGDRLVARDELGIDEGARVILIFGVQAVHRKNLDTLAKALEHFAPRNTFYFLFIGMAAKDEPHPFSAWRSQDKKVKVVIENDFVEESKVRKYFAVADRVWANYRDFPGASGVLLQAMGYGRLVIASNQGEIASLCRHHNLGQTVRPGDPSDLRALLSEIDDMPHHEQLEWEKSIISTANAYAWPRIADQLLEKLQTW